MFQTLKRLIITGLFLLIPIGLTFLVVGSLITYVDSTLAPVADGFIGRHIPGLGILTALAVAVATGILAENIIGHRLFEVFEDLIAKIPVLNWVYGTIKQVFDAFSPQNMAAFKRVVLVEFPRKGVYSLGFMTNDIVVENEGKKDQEMVTVYIPTNHVYLGDFVMVPKEDILPTDISVQEGVQCALSAGAAIPERVRVTRL